MVNMAATERIKPKENKIIKRNKKEIIIKSNKRKIK